MRSFLFHCCIGLMGCWALLPAKAAGEPQRIYRCGNAYTNQPDPSARCQLLTGGHVTVIEGTRVQGSQPVEGHPSAGSNVGMGKVDTAEQRHRDTQAQAVLQAELHKAQSQHAELLREWNNGEPERRADEFHQPQKYQARMAQLRTALQRTEADVAGLQRELQRLSVPVQAGGKP
jgi:hypothetical protein